MKKTVSVIVLSMVMLLTLLSLRLADLDPGYIKAFGYGSICVSGNGYPQIAKYDPAQFDYHDGKFFIQAKTQFDLRVLLPEGKTYGDLMNDFLRRKPHAKDKRTDKVIWRVFASHDINGNKIFDHFPPSPEEIPGEVNYITSPKELCFTPLDEIDVSAWKTSGAAWSDSRTNLSMICYNWLFEAKPGWQLYIVHTVGYYTIYENDDHYVVDAPICKALVEVK
ncbi:MAG: hypothetical protein NTU98_01150 [Bacteroidetes bacterium]|nr:hypothetical protein [Bacteroidota bacterium]